MHFCMDWARVGFDWNRARAFLVTAEEGSFSAAARALGSAQPTIGRQVTALEEELGGGDDSMMMMGEDSATCSCVYGNPCLVAYNCKDWANRFDVAKRNGWRGFS